MKFKAQKIDVLNSSEGNVIVQLIIKDYQDKRNAMYGITQLKELDQLSVEVKKYREKRSLQANAYLWKLLYEIAVKINRSKDDVYLMMLERYGIFTHIVVKPNMVDKVKNEWKTIRELGEVEIKGKKGIQLQCYFGSSTYNTKEFSHLLDGVVNEAKELEIETLDELEQKRMIESMEVKK